MTQDQFSSPAYKRSRRAYCLQAAFEYFIAILVSDVYLAKLLTHIGIDDALIGIISSFISAAFLFQLTAVFLVRHIKNIKNNVIFFNILGCVLFSCLYLIPFLPISVGAKTALVMSGLLLAYFGNYFVSSMLFKWANSFVNPGKRASYSATKEMISLVSGMAFTLIIGRVIDSFEFANNLTAGFLFIACAGLVLSVCCFICLALIAKPTAPSADAAESAAPAHTLKDIFANTFGNKNFLPVIIFSCIWSCSSYLTVGFLGTFKTTDLLLSVTTVSVINIVGNLFRFFLSRPIGRFSDKTSYARGMELALCLAATAFFFNSFTTPKTWYFIVVYTVLHCISVAGTNQNSFNIVYSYVDEAYFVEAMAIKNSISGVVGFVSSLIGAKILSVIQGNGNTVFGMPMYGQQFLSALSCILTIIAILYMHNVIGKQKVMKQ